MAGAARGALVAAILLAALPARAAEPAVTLTRPLALAVQDALVWTSDYSGPLDGQAGERLTEALKRFQSRDGRPAATGRPTLADLSRLRAAAEKARRDVGFEIQVDAANLLALPVPRALVGAPVPTARGQLFSSRDGTLSVEMIALPKGQSEALLSSLKTPARKVEQEVVRRDGFAVLLAEGKSRIVARAVEMPDAVRGFILVYPDDNGPLFEPLAGALANGFDPRPLDGTPWQSTQPTPEWVTEHGDPVALPPAYPTATLDGRRAEVSVEKDRLSVRLVRTDADPVVTGSIGRPTPDVEGEPVAFRIEITVDGRLVTEWTPPPGFAAGLRPTIGLVELDPANALPEVVLTGFTGGSQCCTVMTVFTARVDGSGFAPLVIGEYEGAPDLLRDLDGDGRFEIVAEDDAFLGAFDEYAASFAPLDIHVLDGGVLKRVTNEARFAPAHRAHLNEIWVWARAQNAIATNGFLAAWLATARAVGQGASAQRLVERAYDRDNETGLATCRDAAASERCPADRIERRPFPVALAAFLAARGY